MIVGFSGFGFPKAHGAAFGLLAYQSTWLRVHYGPEFLCALLNEQPMGFYASDTLVHEAQRKGIELLAPDVNASEVECTVAAPAAVAATGPGAPEPGAAGGSVRLGLGYVSGVRAEEVEALVAARQEGGPFRSLADLASRAGAGRPSLEKLAWAGACDSLAAVPARPTAPHGAAHAANGAPNGAHRRPQRRAAAPPSGSSASPRPASGSPTGRSSRCRSTSPRRPPCAGWSRGSRWWPTTRPRG